MGKLYRSPEVRFYLFGLLLTQLGLGDVLQSYDPTTKALELELGDMKDHGMYRIVAVDNDIVSFVDARLPLAPSISRTASLTPLSADGKVVWPGKLPMAPVILITNPKESRFVLDNKEPLHRVQSSTHIRFLVFSDESADKMEFEILIDDKPVIYSDDDNRGNDNQTADTFTIAPRYSGNDKYPLWTLPWNPAAYKDGAHILSIKAKSARGDMGASSIIFRTDGRRTKIGGGAGEWIISTHMSTVVSTYIQLGWYHLLVIVLTSLSISIIIIIIIIIVAQMHYFALNSHNAHSTFDSSILF